MKQRSAAPGAMPHAALLTFSSLETLDDGVPRDGRPVAQERLRGRTHDCARHFNAENDMATANSMAKEMASGKYGYIFSISTNCLQAVANANREGRAKHIFGVWSRTRWRQRSGLIR